MGEEYKFNTTTVTFVFGPNIDTYKKTSETLSKLKEIDFNKYQESKTELLEIESRGLEKIIKRRNKKPSILETYIEVLYDDYGVDLRDVSIGYSIKEGNYHPTIVINVDEIKSNNKNTQNDFLNEKKLNQLGSLLGDGLNTKWVRVDIVSPQ